MKIWYVDLHVPIDEMVKNYAEEATRVFAWTHDGKKVAFPAQSLKPFMTHEGVHGRFKIQCNDQGKLHSIKKLSS